MSPQPPPGSADKSIGEIVQEVSEKAQLLVREEIELAKAEVVSKATKLGKGAGVAAVAGVFFLFALFFLLEGLAWLFADIVDSAWLGFFILVGLLVILGAIAGFVAYRFFLGGNPPTPDMAIEEAKLTQATIEEAIHAPAPGDVAAHREEAAEADTSDVKKDSGPKTEVKVADKADKADEEQKPDDA
ncbi:MAG: phage holin family protein [Thermoleophilaceae bacterium]|nr:phage holin family protein [Thermoleophilaceae bacterium]